MGNGSDVGFKIWGVDNQIYGPVELPVLVGWVKEERVLGDTWIFSEHEDTWQKASKVPELQMFFRKKPAPGAGTSPRSGSSDRPAPDIKPGLLRRVKVLGAMSDEQLEQFVQFMEVIPVREFTELVKQGQIGDAMYLVLEGELRVRIMIDGKETCLVTLQPGEFFGEISLFDHGPRSADVIANKESTLLKIDADAFEKLLSEAPQLAAPFLFAISKTLTARIRADNKRYRDSIQFARAAGK